MFWLFVIICPDPLAKSRKAPSGAFNLRVFPSGSPLLIDGIFRRANLENLNLLIELLNVKDKSSAEDEKE
jgi:hypothetical protein